MIKRIAPWDGLLHEAVEHNGVLHFSGIVAEDSSLDMEGQTRDVLRQLGALLDANGSSRSHLLSVLIFITDMKAKPGMNKAWREWIGPTDLPTRATIGVADLDGVLIELVATAAKKG